MAFLLPNYLPSSLNLQSKSKEKTATAIPPPPAAPPYLHLQLAQTPAALGSVQLQAPPTPNATQDNKQKNDFYVNLGVAIRTLREDLPQLFSKDLNYDIYRDDITLVDPLNTFTGIDKYKLIFWALRFHGRVLFREINLEVLRIWQPSENMILIRWNLRGIPRVPWEAKGEFQGTSRYKLDRNGKIYEHKVDNIAFNFPRKLKPAVSVLDMVTAGGCPASPNPTFSWADDAVYCSVESWVEFYRVVVRETLERGNEMQLIIGQEGLVTC